MKVVIINYKAGNIKSVAFAAKRLGFETELSGDFETIQKADKVIFPGVGEAKAAMNALKESHLDELIPTLKQPVLSICLGMQLLFSESEERNTKGLGVIKGKVTRFSESLNLKIPHIGWNRIYNLKSDLLSTVNESSFVYFVHGFYAPIVEETIATCNYGLEFTAAVRKNNFYGTQFHPEKSGDIGSKILKQFLQKI